MRIARIECLAYRASLSEPFGFSQWWFKERSACLVRVCTDDGVEGWGEIFANVHPAIYGPIVEEVFAPLYLGASPLDRDVLWENAYNRTRDFGRKGVVVSALSGLDIALWDLAGKIFGVPVSTLLGGGRRRRIEAYASGLYFRERENVAAALAEEASGYAAQGFRHVKMKVGRGVAEDARNVREVRAALGPDVGLAIDANHAYGVASAVKLGRLAAEYGLEWFEEPVAPEDLVGYAEVRAMQPAPVAGGEAEYTRFGFRDMLLARAVDIAQPDLCAAGGLSEGRKIAALTSAFGALLQPHVWGTPVGTAAALHFLDWLPPVPGSETPWEPLLELDQTEHPVRDAMIGLPNELPFFAAPSGPGLGIEVSPDDVAGFLVGTWVAGK